MERLRIDTGEAVISVSRGGTGPGVLLLHGFPQTQLMWRDIAPRLAQRFTVVCADLRGYGDSSTPPSSPDHAPYSKRVMARDMISVMKELGFEHFFIAGHDRGGRVAYTAALSDAEHVHAICEEYRAAAGIDRDHDAADRAAGRRISCPVLALWSGSGPLSSWYEDVGGPLALWSELATSVTGEPVDGGHFFPEERPSAVADALSDFFTR
jgi:pimeloyl-ACP methyl ester carboxylesterase